MAPDIPLPFADVASPTITSPRLTIHGSAEIQFEHRDGATRLARLFHHDPLRVLFPNPRSGDLALGNPGHDLRRSGRRRPARYRAVRRPRCRGHGHHPGGRKGLPLQRSGRSCLHQSDGRGRCLDGMAAAGSHPVRRRAAAPGDLARCGGQRPGHGRRVARIRPDRPWRAVHARAWRGMPGKCGATAA